jgi:hypothetical protein
MRPLAIICWLVGAVLILVPAALIAQAWNKHEDMKDPKACIIAAVVGLVVLGTGGTFYRIAVDSEQRQRRRRRYREDSGGPKHSPKQKLTISLEFGWS